MNKIKKQMGFALIEVMIAALVMVVGSVAFLRLQQTALQTTFNNYARSQGTVIVNAFAEQMRSNIGLLRVAQASGNPLEGRIEAGAMEEATTAECSSEQSPEVCSQNILALHSSILSQQMANVSGNSALCYLERAAGTGHVRVTYMWQDNSALGQNAAVVCPDAFNAQINANNSVTIYVQI